MDTHTSYKDTFMASLQRLKNKQVMTDVSLKLPDQSTISCHKLVLMAASPFFETMFQSGMKESTQQEVKLDFSDAVTIKMIVDYFYSGEIDINAGNVQDLVAASEFLCLADLKEHLGAFMTDQIDSTNCIGFYRYARKFSLGKLIPHCLEYLLVNFNQASRSSDAFIQLSEEELVNVISDDRLTADNEDIVFHSVVRWVNADLEKRKEAFVKIASFVRFPFCTQGLLDHVAREPLMMNSACMDILSEAISVRSPFTHSHLMHSARCIPRNAHTGKKPHLVRAYQQSVEQQVQHPNHHRNAGLQYADEQTTYVILYTNHIQSTDCISTQTPQWLTLHGPSATSSPVSNFFFSSSGIHWIDSEGSHYNWLADASRKLSFNWVNPNMTDFSLTFIQDKLFALGGKIKGTPCPIVESLDPIQRQWKPEPSMLQPCSKPYIVHFGTKVYVLGGVDANGPSLFMQQCDPVWGTWQLKKEMPGVCQSGAAVALNDNIFVVGGTERACFRYTPATDTWTVLSQPTHVHNVSTAATAWKGHILLCSKDEGEEYNPGTDTWSACDALVPNENGAHHGMLLCTIFK